MNESFYVVLIGHTMQSFINRIVCCEILPFDKKKLSSCYSPNRVIMQERTFCLWLTYFTQTESRIPVFDNDEVQGVVHGLIIAYHSRKMSETDLHIDEELVMSIQEGEEVPITLPLTPDQIQNNARGYVNRTPDKARLQRFLCLGSESGTFFVDQKELKKENAECILRYFYNHSYVDHILLSHLSIIYMY